MRPYIACLFTLVLSGFSTAPLTAEIVITGTGTVFLTTGSDPAGINGATIFFEHKIANGTRWSASGSFFFAPIEESTVVVNGEAWLIGGSELPLQILHTGAGEQSRLIDADSFTGFDFSGHGGTGNSQGTWIGTPWAFGDGDLVKASELPLLANAYHDFFTLNHPGDPYTSVYFIDHANFQISGSNSVPEPTSVLGLVVGGLAILSRRRARR